MASGTIVFVHGTGTRLKNYQSTFRASEEIAAANGISATLIECAWGDPLGVTFRELSLPAGPSDKQTAADDEDFARWSWLFDDPLFELEKLTIRDTSHVAKRPPQPGAKAPYLVLWQEIEVYKPSQELALLLERGGLSKLWPSAWTAIVKKNTLPKEAFKASAHELPDACAALARALVAELHVLAVSVQLPGPDRELRKALVSRLMSDWKQQVYGLGAFLSKQFKRAATSVVRHNRASLSGGAALPIGDILLYQARGDEIRNFIRAKIENAKPPVAVVAHSLGGIAVVDLLALPNPPKVSHLVTAGSQAPLLFELGALLSMKPVPKPKPPYPLPSGFPPWLNIYDRDDFLSYVGRRLFKGIVDEEFHSGQPFPDSHSAYFGAPAFWKRVGEFTAT